MFKATRKFYSLISSILLLALVGCGLGIGTPGILNTVGVDAKQDPVNQTVESSQQNLIHFPSLVTQTPISRANEYQIKQAEARSGRHYTIKMGTVIGGQIPTVLANTISQRIPASGEFELQLTPGAVFGANLDRAIASHSVLTLPQGNYEFYIQAWGRDGSRATFAEAGYAHNSVIDRAGGAYDYYYMGRRSLPIPSSWQIGDRYHFRIRNSRVSELTIRIFETSQSGEPPTGVSVIGSEGGEANLPGVASVEIPAGALPQDKTIKISQLTSLSGIGKNTDIPYAPISITPTGTTFSKPIRITFQSNGAALRSTLAQSMVCLTSEDGNNWTRIPVEDNLNDASTVTASANHLSDFVVYRPVNRNWSKHVVITPTYRIYFDQELPINSNLYKWFADPGATGSVALNYAYTHYNTLKPLDYPLPEGQTWIHRNPTTGDETNQIKEIPVYLVNDYQPQSPITNFDNPISAGDFGVYTVLPLTGWTDPDSNHLQTIYHEVFHQFQYAPLSIQKRIYFHETLGLPGQRLPSIFEASARFMGVATLLSPVSRLTFPNVKVSNPDDYQIGAELERMLENSVTEKTVFDWDDQYKASILFSAIYNQFQSFSPIFYLFQRFGTTSDDEQTALNRTLTSLSYSTDAAFADATLTAYDWNRYFTPWQGIVSIPRKPSTESHPNKVQLSSNSNTISLDFKPLAAYFRTLTTTTAGDYRVDFAAPSGVQVKIRPTEGNDIAGDFADLRPGTVLHLVPGADQVILVSTPGYVPTSNFILTVSEVPKPTPTPTPAPTPRTCGRVTQDFPCTATVGRPVWSNGVWQFPCTPGGQMSGLYSGAKTGYYWRTATPVGSGFALGPEQEAWIYPVGTRLVKDTCSGDIISADDIVGAAMHFVGPPDPNKK